MSNDPNRPKRELFFKVLFEGCQGIVCIARQKLDDSTWNEHFFEIPKEYNLLLDHIERFARGHNLWYCPQVLSDRRRTKDNVVLCPTAWSDLDTCDPKKVPVPPTIAVESSPGRYQALWRFTTPQPPEVGERISRRIAYAHATDGADKSGWDLTQLLRVPFTPNYKYPNTAAGGPPTVKIVSAAGAKYEPEEFDVFPEAPIPIYEQDIPLPTNTRTSSEIIAAHEEDLNPIVGVLLTQPPQEHRRSDDLWRLEVSLFESGLTRAEVFAVVRDAPCNKYEQDGRTNPDQALWKEVLKAEEYQKSMAPTRPKGPQYTDLLTEEERQWVRRTKTIVEEYMQYGESATDASPQYHQAGAFIILSSLLSGAIQIPTSHSTIPLNLWFMILAGTTLTRKSTAMEKALEIVLEVDSDALLASDGSVEGLFSGLASRPGRASLFRRDEIAGFLEGLNRKDYQAGMMEMLSNLYDGSTQKRILSKSTILLHKPRLIFFAGGIRSRVEELLSHSHVESGFLPRFVIITADADPNRVRPEGPPTEENVTLRHALINRLHKIKAHYDATIRVAVGKKVATSKKTWDATLTPEAWEFYNGVAEKMRKDAYASDNKALLIPTYERLVRSGMKCAALIAAAERLEDKVIVQKDDLVRAFYYVEDWRRYAHSMVTKLDQGPFERILSSVAVLVVERPGISRAHIMTQYKLKSKETDELLATMEQRGLALRKGVRGRTERLYPILEPN